jgi:HPt (histidine-containing phosphotransfer) domain-containing protein
MNARDKESGNSGCRSPDIPPDPGSVTSYFIFQQIALRSRGVCDVTTTEQSRNMMRSEEVRKEMDLDIALSHVDGDRQLLAELAALFLQDYPRLLEEIRESIPKADFAVLERGAHTLKGRLAFFGIQRIREMALGLEIMGRKHDLSQAGQSLAAIEEEMQGILPQFEDLVREQDP